jgi:hypothetical protein
MSQNRETGAAADRFGRSTARAIAQRIGAVMVRRGSNEAEYKGERVVIKCASRRTDSVGVTYKMLPKLSLVIGAFAQDDGRYQVIALSSKLYKNHMTDTKSKGPSAGKVGIVKRKVFKERGAKIARVRAEP